MWSWNHHRVNRGIPEYAFIFLIVSHSSLSLRKNFFFCLVLWLIRFIAFINAMANQFVCIIIYLFLYAFFLYHWCKLFFGFYFYNDVKKVFFIYDICCYYERKLLFTASTVCISFGCTFFFLVCNMKNGKLIHRWIETNEVKSKLNFDRCESSYVDLLGIANYFGWSGDLRSGMGDL